MASLTDPAFRLADDLASKISEEALDEFNGDSKRSWALILIAFLLGAVVAAVAIGFTLRRTAETISDSGTDIEPDAT